MPKKPGQFGKLPPQYNFFLNPYKNKRFTLCPQCGGKMRQRKLPLVIHVDPMHPVSINHTCRYCPACDLLIAYQDQIELMLTSLFEQHAPELVGNKYLVMGTFDYDFWKQGTKTPHTVQSMVDHLHDFKQVLTFKPAYGWVEKEKPSPKSPAPPAQERRHPNISPLASLIDDSNQIKVLMDKMQANMPILVRPTPELVKLAKKQGLSIQRNDNLHIRNVFYLGDEGGIMCDITPEMKTKEVLVCSLTHLEVVGDDSMASEMRAYQHERHRKMGIQEAKRRSRK